MMKTHMWMSVAALALGATSALAEEVRVYNWSDYIDEALLEKFEAETGLNDELQLKYRLDDTVYRLLVTQIPAEAAA